MAPIALKAQWEVTAGLIPGQVDPELTRRFNLTNVENENATGPPTVHPFTARQFEATAYVHELQNLCAVGRTCNWIRLDFVWL
jgi:hypothetical protein